MLVLTSRCVQDCSDQNVDLTHLLLQIVTNERGQQNVSRLSFTNRKWNYPMAIVYFLFDLLEIYPSDRYSRSEVRTYMCRFKNIIIN